MTVSLLIGENIWRLMMEVEKMSKYRKILGVAVIVLVLVIAAGATMAFAQEGDNPPDDGALILDMESPWARLAHRFRHWWNQARWREIMNSALANELDITVDELYDARNAARLTALEQLVDEELVSEERADLIIARLALASTIEKGELTAQALGITVEELVAAREEGKNLRQLVMELELAPATVRGNLKAAYDEAIQQAVIEGVLTQEQADLLLENPPRPDRR